MEKIRKEESENGLKIAVLRDVEERGGSLKFKRASLGEEAPSKAL